MSCWPCKGCSAFSVKLCDPAAVCSAVLSLLWRIWLIQVMVAPVPLAVGAAPVAVALKPTCQDSTEIVAAWSLKIVKINKKKKMVKWVSQDKLKGQWRSLNIEFSWTAFSAKMTHYMWRIQGRGSSASRSQHDLSHRSLVAESQCQAVTDGVQVSFPT